MASSAQLLKALQKNHGEKVGSIGGTLVDTQRVPTGVFAFDLATGGGFPRGCLSVVFGPESSGKTNLLLRSVAMHQLLWPTQVCVFFDIEHSFNPEWAQALGVDTTRLIVMSPLYIEQAIDMIEGFLDAEDCGLVAIDSLAAFITSNEAESDGSKVAVGGASQLTGKLIRKMTLCLNKASQQGRRPTVLAINQTRMKIGVMFGNPETMSGGNAPKFAAALIARVSGKNIMDPKISKVMPVAKETHFVIQKWKVPITSVNGTFTMAMVAHKNLAVGECDDWTTIASYMANMGMLHKGEGGKGWVVAGEVFPTLIAARERIYADKVYGTLLRQQIIKKQMEAGLLPPEVEADGPGE